MDSYGTRFGKAAYAAKECQRTGRVAFRAARLDCAQSERADHPAQFHSLGEIAARRIEYDSDWTMRSHDVGKFVQTILEIELAFYQDEAVAVGRLIGRVSKCGLTRARETNRHRRQ